MVQIKVYCYYLLLDITMVMVKNNIVTYFGLINYP